MTKYHQGIYKVVNRAKYMGNDNPIYKSSIEKRAFYYFDHNQNVMRWGYELMKVPYFFTVDQKWHNYYPDAYVELRSSNGELKNLLVEIKPQSQNVWDSIGNIVLPKPPKRKTAKSWNNYQKRLLEATKNVCKWEAAKKFCIERGWEFKIVTDQNLGMK